MLFNGRVELIHIHLTSKVLSSCRDSLDCHSLRLSPLQHGHTI